MFNKSDVFKIIEDRRKFLITICSSDFDIDQIANSGQCFRIEEISPQTWGVIALSKRLIIRRIIERAENKTQDNLATPNPITNDSPAIHLLECTQSEYDNIWFHYFDMSRDYSQIKSEIRATDDPYLLKAVNFGYGIRILQQDPWEILISFIISQRNNISRIRKTIKKLCAPYGLRFPSPAELSQYSEEDLRNIGLGYRARYVKNAAIAVASGSINLKKLRQIPYEEALKQLKKQGGIGDKVANCIALFGLRKLEAFPIDTWIMKILEREYGAIQNKSTKGSRTKLEKKRKDETNTIKSDSGLGNSVAKNTLGTFDPQRFPGYAGIVQQYMFYYERFGRI